MSWLAYSLMAAMLWGITYTFSGQLVKHLSIFSIQLFGALGVIIFSLIMGFLNGGFEQDWQTLKKLGPPTKFLASNVLITAMAQMFILLSIKSKNPTLAGMVEITYPLFTVLFTWLLFREMHLNAGILFGALLILSGVSCVYIFSKNI